MTERNLRIGGWILTLMLEGAHSTRCAVCGGWVDAPTSDRLVKAVARHNRRRHR